MVAASHSDSEALRRLQHEERSRRGALFVEECDGFEDLLVAMAEGVVRGGLLLAASEGGAAVEEATPRVNGGAEAVSPLGATAGSSNSAAPSGLGSGGGGGGVNALAAPSDPFASYRSVCAAIDGELSAAAPDPVVTAGGRRARRLRVITSLVARRDEGSPERARLEEWALAMEAGSGGIGRGAAAGGGGGLGGGGGGGEAAAALAAREAAEWRALQRLCDDTYGPLDVPPEVADDIMLRVTGARCEYL